MENENEAYPSSELLLQITNEDKLDNFVQSFALYRDLIDSATKRAGKPLSDANDILDFGCGAGRLYYAFRDHLRDGQTISACDLNERAVAWCKGLGYKSVLQNSARERIEFPDSSFDLIIAVSVFTHLEIELQHYWAAELQRLLRPGGCLFFTVHGPSFFPKLVENYTNHPHAISFKVSHIGGDALFADMRFSGGVDEDPQGQREVATAHTAEAVKRIFKGFDVAIHDEQTSLAGHDVYLIVKR